MIVNQILVNGHILHTRYFDTRVILEYSNTAFVNLLRFPLIVWTGLRKFKKEICLILDNANAFISVKPDWNFYNKQAHNRPRNWRLSASWGLIKGLPSNPSNITTVHGPEGLKVTRNWALITCRDVHFSKLE